MKEKGVRLCSAVAIVIAFGMAGCLSTEKTKIAAPIVAAFKGEHRVDHSLLDRPPQTVAVLPFVNRTDKKEAFDIVRRSFHGHFSRLNYSPMPLYKVDDLLRQRGLDSPEKVAQASGQKLGEILRVDAIIRGEITHYDRIYVGVYSQVAVGAEVRMSDGKSDKELWWAKNVSRKHAGGISTTPVGLILVALSTALNMREIELLRSSDDLFRDMVKTIPQPALAQALRPPSITILAHDGLRRSDNYANKVGDVIKVAMEGDARMKATFRISNFKENIPLKEEEPGIYTGSYKIMPGDNIEEALIIGTLINDAGNATEWVDVLGRVTIDTIPPGMPKGLSAVGRDRAVDLNWSKNEDKDLAKYKIYRSPTPLTGYQVVGITELTTFQDVNLTNYESFYYKIAALDLAGNESKLSDPAKATPVTPGPTPVRGMISSDTTWYAGASPYILESEVWVGGKATLTAEPGTVIRSKGEGIFVSGKLIARGGQNSLITFEAGSPTQSWKGIFFNRTKNEESIIEYTRISRAVTGITCLSSSPLILHNEISENDVGIRVRESFSKPKILGNVISSNANAGVEVSGSAAPIVEENEIRGNKKDGVFSQEATLVLKKNQVLHNGETGIRLLSSPSLLIHNNIHDNGIYEVYNTLERDIKVEAQENWWGTKEGAKIIPRIFGRVDYQRVLDAPYPLGKPFELTILKSPLSGPIERDSFLILANSPYVLEKELTIDKGAILFIEPGVTLKYNPDASIVVKDGGLDARGTADRAIIFTSSSSSPSAGSYPSAVRFEQPTQVGSFFRYCIVEHAETGLDIAYGAPDIVSCLITNHSQVGIKMANNAAPKIFFSTFTNNLGTGAVVVLGGARPKMNRNNFRDNSFAIQSFSWISLDARENWWGSTPPKESLFLGEVNYQPWLEALEERAFGGRKP